MYEFTTCKDIPVISTQVNLMVMPMAHTRVWELTVFSNHNNIIYIRDNKEQSRAVLYAVLLLLVNPLP